jgi:hypothetical protein
VTPGRGTQPLASGRALRGVLRTLKDRCDPAVFRRIIEAAGSPAVFGEPIRTLGWYPYAAYSGLLVAADRALGNGTGSFCRDLGVAGGQRDVSTVLRIYVVLSSPERLIRACSKVWPSYYSGAGRMEALRWAPDDTLLRISDFPEMHPFHCRLMEGWMISTMDMIGLAAKGHERECASAGGKHHEFVCTWHKK